MSIKVTSAVDFFYNKSTTRCPANRSDGVWALSRSKCHRDAKPVGSLLKQLDAVTQHNAMSSLGMQSFKSLNVYTKLCLNV